MLTKTLPFSTLVSRGRWNVEFLCSNGNGRHRGAFEHVRLADVFTERRERLNPQQFPDHTFNYVSLEHVQSVTGDLVDYAPRPGGSVLSVSKVFRQGDLLYGRLRPGLNKVFLADEQIPEGICSGEFHVLIPDSRRVLPHFARALLASSYVQEAVGGLTTGSALPRLQLEDLLAIRVPLPPLDDQERYENVLISEEKRRFVLARELATRPHATLTALVNTMETGEPFKIVCETGTPETYRQFKLPTVANIRPPAPIRAACATAGSGSARRSGRVSKGPGRAPRR